MSTIVALGCLLLLAASIVVVFADAGDSQWGGVEAAADRLRVVQQPRSYRRPIHVGPLAIARLLERNASEPRSQRSAGNASVGDSLPLSSSSSSTNGTTEQVASRDDLRVGCRCDVGAGERFYLGDDEFVLMLHIYSIIDPSRADAPVVVETLAYCYWRADEWLDEASGRLLALCRPCDPRTEKRHLEGRHLSPEGVVAICVAFGLALLLPVGMVITKLNCSRRLVERLKRVSAR